MPAAQMKHSRIDASGEVNSFGLYTPVLDATNIAEYTDSLTPAALLADLLTAVDAVTLSERYSTSQSALAEQVFDGSLPAQPAQNELRLLIKYNDTVEPVLKGRIEIPGVDAAVVGSSGTDEVDLSGTEMAALVTQIEAFAVSKIGNPISVYEARIVGRNS